MIKLDYTLTSPEERNELVKQILAETPNPTEKYLEILADYLVFAMDKEEKKQKNILTDNIMVTVNKRERSYEGLAAQLENGEDGIYNMLNDSKYIIFQPKKKKISNDDLESIPFLKQVKEAIEYWEEKLITATGKDRYIIKQALIELRKDQYTIRTAYLCPIILTKHTHSTSYIALNDNTHEFDDKGYPIPEGVSLLNPKVCEAILCNYSKLKQSSWDQFEGDVWYLLLAFDELCEIALKPFPLYERLVECKIDGMSNIEIQETLQMEFGIKHSVEYISSLWRNKIPKLIASAAEDQFLYDYYLNVEKGKYKKCNRCGEIKLAHNKYFSKNKTSRDSFYSICKNCRNAKARKN